MRASSAGEFPRVEGLGDFDIGPIRAIGVRLQEDLGASHLLRRHSPLLNQPIQRLPLRIRQLAAENELEGWRQHGHLLGKVRKLVQAIGRVARAKSRGTDRLKPGYQKLLALAEDVLARARRLLGELAFAMPKWALTVEELKSAVAPAQREKLLLHYVSLTAKVRCRRAAA